MRYVNRQTRIVLLLALAAVIAGAALVPALGAGFFFDDFDSIAKNPLLSPPLTDLADWWRASHAFDQGGRQLAMLTFAANIRLAGMDPWWMQSTNLLFHLANMLLVFCLARTVLARVDRPPPRSGSAPGIVAVAVSLAWAAHPLQVSTVAYIVQRMEMLAAFFTLLALNAYLCGRLRQLRGRRHGWWFLSASLVLAGLAYSSKETGLNFLPYVLVLEAALLRWHAFDVRDARTLKAIHLSAGVVLLAALAWESPRYLAASAYANWNFGAGQKLLTELRVTWTYLGQITWPRPSTMHFYYDNYPLSTHLWAPWTTALAALATAALIGSAVAARRAHPLYSLGIGWFLLGHLATSALLPVEIAYEHRNYLPLLGIVMAGVAVAAEAARRLPDSRLVPRAMVGVALAALVLLTALRAQVWGDPGTRAYRLYSDNPTSPQAGYDFARYLLGSGQGHPTREAVHAALVVLERTAALPGASPMADQALILVGGTPSDPDKAVYWARLTEKVRVQPYGPSQRNAVLPMLGRYARDPDSMPLARLANLMQVVVDKQPEDAARHVQFSDFAYVALGDEALSLQHLGKALALDADPALAAALRAQMVQQQRPDAAAYIDRLLAHRQSGGGASSAGARPDAASPLQ